MDNKVSIALKGQEYNGKLDMKCLANVQAELKKQGENLTMEKIFNAIGEQDLTVVIEIAVQSILRCHKSVKRSSIEDKMDFSEMDNVFNFIAALAEVAMPKAQEGKQIEE